ncbi:3'-5' exonuclease [Corynebacterium sp.]|uniref:3'-5' exonuclease n=1 Tax=Corynebacterium sp. TaxID=1720 RepID=UPI00258010BC|nr:3'-5' exonuclease [Corynebacterium sp.]
MSAHTSYAVIDFETTGLSSSDRVVEIGVVLLDDKFQVEKTWDTLVNPECAIANSFVHKITDADVAQAPAFADIANTVASLLAGRTMVAHDASFEQRFCARSSRALGWSGRRMAIGLLIPENYARSF